MVINCEVHRPETDRERKIRLWNQAKEVYRRIAGPNVVQVVLAKNYLCQIDGMGCISYHWARRTRKK